MRASARLGVTLGAALFIAGSIGSASAAPGDGWKANPGTSYAAGVVTLDSTGQPFGTSYEHNNLPVEITDGDVISFQYQLEDMACGGGVPRVFVRGGAENTWDTSLDCGTESGGWATVTYTLSKVGAVAAPAGHTGIVNDNTSDEGIMRVRNLVIDGQEIALAPAPQSAAECKDGGFAAGDYKNQGECVSAFSGKK